MVEGLRRRGWAVVLIGFLAVMALGRAQEPSRKRATVVVTVENTRPRVDTEGNVIDAHDGCLQFVAGRYYLYGTAYGKTAGFTNNNRFRVYSSADLMHWRFDGELLEAPPAGVYYRPYVVYNATTRKYVLWYNWYPKLWDGQVGVAVSDTPVGPFRIVERKVALTQAKDHPGDGSLFVDDDGTGYFIYTTIGQKHAIRVERLTADYLGSSGAVSEVLGTGCEAPAMFRRAGRYYVVFGHTCCFCTAGSDARVFTASAALGPYRAVGDMNADAGGKPIVGAQQTFVAKLPAADGEAYVWMGDAWNSRPDGVKGHDLQYWSSPLRFGADGELLPLVKEAAWSGTFVRGRVAPAPKRGYVWPQKDEPAEVRVDPCSHAPLNERGEPMVAKP